MVVGVQLRDPVHVQPSSEEHWPRTRVLHVRGGVSVRGTLLLGLSTGDEGSHCVRDTGGHSVFLRLAVSYV